MSKDEKITALFFAWVEEVIAHTQKEYGALYQSVIQRILPDQRDIEECVNDTTLRVWNAIPPKRPASLRAQSSEARRFFQRRYWYGENSREIAEDCQVSEAKVGTTLFRTREHLRDTLEKEGFRYE